MEACHACGVAVSLGDALCVDCQMAAAGTVRALPGIGPVREARLREAGIATVGALWTAPLGDVAAAAGVSIGVAQAWREQARTAIAGETAPAEPGDVPFESAPPEADWEAAPVAFAGEFPGEQPQSSDIPAAPAPRRPRHIRPLVATAVVLSVGLLLVGGAWLLLDLDRDGLSSWRELQLGTSAWQADSDQDGLFDGDELVLLTDPRQPDSDGDHLGDGIETRLGLSPTTVDTDGDAIPDDLELAWGSDPRQTDSDADGLGDVTELSCELDPPFASDVARSACTPDIDCDADGSFAMVDPDDDADQRNDGLEQASERCQSDTDGDGVLDGAERNRSCVVRRDCDGDGVADGAEAASRFSALDSDTFDSGLSDLVTYNFEQAGQAFTDDADGDAIPDGWETSSGVLDWGGFTPLPGRKDLLVEFIRVEGPVSGGRVGAMAFTTAYQAVRDTMEREGNIAMQFQETRVRLDPEPAVDVLLAWQDPTYQDIIKQGRHVGNPYVTTIVLIPAVLQPAEGPLFSGVADGFMSLLSAVDYGGFVKHSFAGTRADGTHASFDLYPADEEIIMAGRAEPAFWATTGQIVVPQSYGTYTWTPRWFLTPPLLTLNDGSMLQLATILVVIDQQALASTILHEIGHNLGLCHSQLADCNAAFTAADQAAQASSSMSYDAAPGTLHFLASEWTQVQADIRCPVGSTLQLLATGATLDNVTADKYSGGGLRRCEHKVQKVLADQFAPDTTMVAYAQPALYKDLSSPPWVSSSLPTVLFGAAGLFVVLAAASLAFVLRRRALARRENAHL